MKTITLALVLFCTPLSVFAATGHSCESAVTAGQFKKMKAWGTKVDVAYSKNITFYKETTAAINELSYKIKEYGGFECPSSKVKFKKISPSCLLINIFWLPGSDRSWCDIYLKQKNKSLGTSRLYMNYY